MPKVINAETPSTSAELPVFVTEENRAKHIAIYDERMTHWPVPCETLFVDTQAGDPAKLASALVQLADFAEPPLRRAEGTHPARPGRRHRELSSSAAHDDPGAA